MAVDTVRPRRRRLWLTLVGAVLISLPIVVLLRPNAKESAPMTADATRRPNRLAKERSPYLQQHAYNPVDWYPWGDEAFAKAKREDKPIFLSIGYSTCYWCHVMEKESFENPAIADLMNQSFVSVKVDREQRPDIDAIYMTAVQAMSGQGGWPMTVIMTPEGKPFWGGTYVPPEDRYGRPGITRLLTTLSGIWTSDREKALLAGNTVAQALQAGAMPSGPPLTQDVLAAAEAQFSEQFDPVHAGFGDAPKFPRSHSLSLLLRLWTRSQDAHVLEMVTKTLDAMAAGGLHDHLGGGFHRYSTDPHWLVPHFEKMLYDQALLARSYVEAYQVTGRQAYADAARDTLDYVLRDLRDAGGAFYCAEDAGEVGHEGEFYVWTPEEIAVVLGPERATRFARVYGVTPAGNFTPPAHGPAESPAKPASILHLARPVADVAGELHIDEATLSAELAESRAALLAARSRRPRPHRDEKVLADWNGLMIGALAYAGRVLDEPRYTKAAEDAAAFVLSTMRRDGHLLHAWRDGHAEVPGFLEDFAFLAHGLLELYEATFEPRWLREAAACAEMLASDFWDAQHGGFWLTGARNEALIARTKELYDGALPSGNSVAAHALMRLALLTQQDRWRELVERQVSAFAGAVHRMPSAFPVFLMAVDVWLGPSTEVVIAGAPNDPTTRGMLREAQSRFLPRAVLAWHPGKAGAPIEALIPFLAAQRPKDGQPTAYVCRDYVCSLPAASPDALRERLDHAAR